MDIQEPEEPETASPALSFQTPQEQAEALGKRILVAIDYFDDEKHVERRSFWGKIIRFTSDGWIVVEIAGKEQTEDGTLVVPPIVQVADSPGYGLPVTGEVVTDLAYLASWDVQLESA